MSTETPIVVRTTLVGRLLSVIYPDDVPSGHVYRLPEIVMHLDIAAGLARGQAMAVPLHAHFPERAPVEVEVEEPRNGRERLNWDDMPLGILSDSQCAEIVGARMQGAQKARTKRGIPSIASSGTAARRACVEALVEAWGEERVRAWMARWPRSREVIGAEFEAAIGGESREDEPALMRTPGRTAVVLVGQLTRDEMAEGKALVDDDTWTGRPKTRADCVGGPRPCPWVSCRHHLAAEIHPRAAGDASLLLTLGHDDIASMTETCALDVADRGGGSLAEIASILGLSKQRVLQIEAAALEHVREAVA